MNFYTDKYLIPNDKKDDYLKSRKESLSAIEKYGLESILNNFVREYNECNENVEEDIKEFTRFLDNGVDILDGRYDTFIFDVYAFSSIWSTEGGRVVLSAIDLSGYTGAEEDREEYKNMFSDRDFYGILNRFDACDFETVLFLLY